MWQLYIAPTGEKKSLAVLIAILTVSTTKVKPDEIKKNKPEMEKKLQPRLV